MLARFLAALSAGDADAVRAMLAPGARLDGAPPGDPVDVLMAQRRRWPEYHERTVRALRQEGLSVAELRRNIERQMIISRVQQQDVMEKISVTPWAASSS